MPAARDNELRILWSRSPPSMRGSAGADSRAGGCRHRVADIAPRLAAAGSTWLCLLHVNF